MKILTPLLKEVKIEVNLSVLDYYAIIIGVNKFICLYSLIVSILSDSTKEKLLSPQFFNYLSLKNVNYYHYLHFKILYFPPKFMILNIKYKYMSNSSAI